MKDVTRSRLVLLMSLPLGVAACTHAMRVKNLEEYVKQAAPARPLTIALEDRSTNPDEREYFRFVHDALATHPAVQSLMPASPVPAELMPDVTVSVRPHPTYSGSWWNYPITFPGFILFMHAWNGYVYNADIDTEITIQKNGRPPAMRDIDTRYRLRHCNFKRGALASSGWYTPGWGGLNAIIGLYMVQYDAASTPEFRAKVGSAYGTYIANWIVELANGEDTNRGNGDRSALILLGPELGAACS